MRGKKSCFLPGNALSRRSWQKVGSVTKETRHYSGSKKWLLSCQCSANRGKQEFQWVCCHGHHLLYHLQGFFILILFPFSFGYIFLDWVQISKCPASQRKTDMSNRKNKTGVWLGVLTHEGNLRAWYFEGWGLGEPGQPWLHCKTHTKNKSQSICYFKSLRWMSIYTRCRVLCVNLMCIYNVEWYQEIYTFSNV